jgi:hypothetical protein
MSLVGHGRYGGRFFGGDGFASAGFRNYDLMQRAACLVDPDTKRYCYLQSVFADRADDGFLYNLPVGTK